MMVLNCYEVFMILDTIIRAFVGKYNEKHVFV